MGRKIGILLAGLAGVVIFAGGLAWAVLWNSTGLQDGIMSGVIASRMADTSVDALLTDGALHIYLCGTGSPMPDPSRANACTAIIAGGHIVIVDTGPGSWRNIAQAKLPGKYIDTILLTHLHSDHIGDLGEFAVQSWIAGRVAPLDIFGPTALPAPVPDADSSGHEFGTSGTADVVNGFAAVYDADDAYRILHHGADHLIPDGADMVAHEIPTPAKDELVTVFDRDGLKISAFLVDHHPVEPAYGYRIEYKGRVAVLSGDTKKVESVQRFSENADLLVHEGLNHRMVSLIVDQLRARGNSRLADMAHDTLDYHTSPVEAAETANAAHVKLLVFSHVVPPLPNVLAERMFLRGVSVARGDGETEIGHDGMLITLPGNSDAIETSSLF